MIFYCILMLLPMLMVYLTRFIIQNKRSKSKDNISIAFFHPYCNAGGGGERVLWCCVKAIQKKYPYIKCIIYTGDGESPSGILRKAEDRFDIKISGEIEFIYLKYRTVVEAKHYPYFTLMMQAIGSFFLGFEAFVRYVPDIYLDTMGYAFTCPIFRYLGGCIVGSYIHYPTISTDMLFRVSTRMEAHNNRDFIASSTTLSFLKVLYYHLFALIYGLVGSCAHFAMVNSSWTSNHIKSLFKKNMRISTVYPPCNTEKFLRLPQIPDSEKPTINIISIGQFRPEKDHVLQLQVFQKFLHLVPEKRNIIKLVLIGGCRNEEDQKRVGLLKIMAKDLQINGNIIWKLDALYHEVLECIQSGTIGLHTMWNEHFGISIVESMAGGLIMVAHNSGGPKDDIIKENDDQVCGYLADNVDSYVDKLLSIINLSSSERDAIRISARESVARFSDNEFEISFLTVIDQYI